MPGDIDGIISRPDRVTSPKVFFVMLYETFQQTLYCFAPHCPRFRGGVGAAEGIK